MSDGMYLKAAVVVKGIAEMFFQDRFFVDLRPCAVIMLQY